MESRSPSGNWLANIVIFHSGKKSAMTSGPPAPSTATRARDERTWPSQPTTDMLVPAAARHTRGAARLHHQIALHFLVHRRAEVRAVERIDARLRGAERDRLRLTGIHHDVDVVARDPEAVQHVPLLLGIRDVQDHGVALRSEEHTSELQSLAYLVCRLLL